MNRNNSGKSDGKIFSYDSCGQEQVNVLEAQNCLEAARHGRMIEREVLRSELRQQEYENKQQQKIQATQIFESPKGIVLQICNGVGTVLRTELLFRCQIKALCRFKRDGTNVCEWLMEIEDGNKMVCSELYSVSDLKSISRLKRTILGRYDCTVASGDKKIAWQWMQEKLLDLYAKAAETIIPSLPGWFLNNGKWNFWVNCEEKSFLAGEIINRFTVDEFQNLSPNEIVAEIEDSVGKISSTANLGVLLIFRMVAFLSRLLVDSPPLISITLFGENSTDVAKFFLRTMKSDVDNFDIFNLDSDNMSWIEKRVLELQDTPAIFISSNPTNRSAHNRLQKVKGWLESGYIEGKKLSIPFIFCTKVFAPVYFINNSIVLCTEEIRISSELMAFAKLQNFVISEIEAGGLYWVGELKKQYYNLSKAGLQSFLTIGQAIVLVLFKMMDLNGGAKFDLDMLFRMAFREIERQFSTDQDILLERFHDCVCDMFENGMFSAVSVCEKVSELKKRMVYFDSEYYFFTSEALRMIGKKLNFDGKSLLLIRQELADRGLIKQYRATGKRKSELNVDIFVGESKERKKVFAVKRTFWDSIGGISLYEKGGE